MVIVSTPKDQWRLSVDTVKVANGTTGIPPALINLDFTITRRLVIPSNLGGGDSENAARALFDLGLRNVWDIVRQAKDLSPEIRSMIDSGWIDAPEGQFSTSALAQLTQAAEGKMTWKVVGSFDEVGRCEGIISCGGYEVRVPLTRATIDAVQQRVAQQRDLATAVLNNPASSDAEKKAAEVAVHAALCVVGIGVIVGGVRDPLTILGTADQCYEAYDEIKAAIDAAAKKAAEAKAEAALRGGESDAPEGTGDGFRKEGDMLIG